jgi:ferritin-like metal-binding protein YciE
MMSSDDTVIACIRGLQEIEERLGEVYKSVYERVPDEKLKDTIKEHITSEENHKKLLKEALDLVSAYE